MPEIIDPVFAKTSQYARGLLSEKERFGLVFVKTGSINSDTELLLSYIKAVLHVRNTVGGINNRQDVPQQISIKITTEAEGDRVPAQDVVLWPTLLYRRVDRQV